MPQGKTQDTTHNVTCPILILAAGSSRRMRGRDKLLEPVNNQPLIRLECERAVAAGQPVYAAVPSLDHPRALAVADLPVALIPIPDSNEGIGATLRTSIPRLPDGVQGFMIVLGDLVALNTDDFVAMLRALETYPENLIWRGATRDAKPGHPIVFHHSLRDEFSSLKGDEGAAQIVAAHKDRMHLVELGPQARLDLDTPEDWAEWRAH